MTTAELPRRIARSLSARLGDVRSSHLLSPSALREARRARLGFPVSADHRPHLYAALAWLERAQDATGGAGGISRGFSMAWSAYFRSAGWQPAYPETTGYIIPTLFSAARRLHLPELAERAVRAARWEIAVRLPDGSVQGGVIGEARAPAVFNTGQVVLGWLAALEERGDDAFADAARRACAWLADAERDGRFVHGESRRARPDATAYNARTAWAMAEAGVALAEPRFTDAAARVLRRVAFTQHTDGWFPDCCLNDPRNPLLHTLAYTARGLVEGGRVLRDARLVDAGARAADALRGKVDGSGWLAGRFGEGWKDAALWSCLTGQCQIANVWMRLDEMEGGRTRAGEVARVLGYVKSTQDREARDGGMRGGIAGSWPPDGEYGRWEMLSWAAKFFADALMRDEAATGGGEPVSRLA
jgi:hypothetical protein